MSFYNEQKVVSLSLNVDTFGGQGVVQVDYVGDVPAADTITNPALILNDPLTFTVV